MWTKQQELQTKVTSEFISDTKYPDLANFNKQNCKMHLDLQIIVHFIIFPVHSFWERATITIEVNNRRLQYAIIGLELGIR